MKKNRYNFWTKKENIISEAKKYTSLKDFYTNSSSAYYASLKLGITNEFTWFDKNTEIESKKYKSRGEFAKKSPTAYKYALKNKLLNKYTWLSNKMDKKLGFWNNKNNVIEESKKYKTRTEFYKKCTSAYRSAIKHCWIDELIWLKNERKVKRGFWTIENLKKEAKKYTTKSELLKNNKSAYVIAKKKGLINILYDE